VALLARTESELSTVAREIEKGHGRARAIACDVAVPLDVERAARTVLGEMGAPQVVVNNAGIIRRAPIDAMDPEEWQRVLDVNLTGAFLVTRALLPAMRSAGTGRFIQVASISSTLGTAGASAYCASKWGLVGFTKSLAEELRGTPLVAMSILPGSVDTSMLKGSGFSPDMTPEDVAETIVYLALDAPPAMNGTSLEMFGP